MGVNARLEQERDTYEAKYYSAWEAYKKMKATHDRLLETPSVSAAAAERPPLRRPPGLKLSLVEEFERTSVGYKRGRGGDILGDPSLSGGVGSQASALTPRIKLKAPSGSYASPKEMTPTSSSRTLLAMRGGQVAKLAGRGAGRSKSQSGVAPSRSGAGPKETTPTSSSRTLLAMRGGRVAKLAGRGAGRSKSQSGAVEATPLSSQMLPPRPPTPREIGSDPGSEGRVLVSPHGKLVSYRGSHSRPQGS